MSNRTAGSRPRKEAFYVQIENADNAPVFVNVSQQLGKKLGFSKPLTTAIMQVRDDAVLFSVLKLYKKASEKLLSEPLALPPGPLKKLERSITNVTEPLTESQLRIDIDKGPSHVLELKRDENGVVTLDLPADVEEASFELPRRPLALTLYLTSPRTGRLIVVGWQGYQAKPGDPETVVRAAAQALNHIAGLAEFQILANVTAVKVPAPPGRYQVIAPTRKASDRVEFDVPVRLWTEDPAAGSFAQGQVRVVVDLDNANPTTSQFMFHATPDKALAEHFDGYKPVLDRALSAAYAAFFDADELTDLVCNITLADISDGDIGRLREAGGTVGGFELNPRQFAPMAL